MHYTSINQTMPRLTLERHEIELLTIQYLKGRDGNSFQFTYLTTWLANYLQENKYGFPKSQESLYTKLLDNSDIAIIREIVWDQIILRYLTLRDYHNDNWPHISLTAKSKEYYQSK